MKSLRRIGAFVATAGVVVLMALPQLASAQATRTWVSGVGDDVNPCSRTAPCKTFAGAISKTAAGGIINCIDPGGFGAVTITKSLMIDCRGVEASVLVSGSNGILISGADIHVVLRNIDLEGLGTGLSGVKVLQAASVHLEDVTIRGFTNGVEFASTPAPSSGTAYLTMVRVLSRLNIQHGALIAPGAGNAFVSATDSAFSGNTLTGMRLNDNSFAAIEDSTFTSNGTHGVAAVSSGAAIRVSLARVTSSLNVNGGLLASGPAAVFQLNNVVTTSNAYGLYPPINGGQYVSYGGNRTSGNFVGDGAPTMTLSSY
jgi:hypothetical protein